MINVVKIMDENKNTLKPKNSKKEYIECEICNRKFQRRNKPYHEKSKLHEYNVINFNIKKIQEELSKIKQ